MKGEGTESDNEILFFFNSSVARFPGEWGNFVRVFSRFFSRLKFLKLDDNEINLCATIFLKTLSR